MAFLASIKKIFGGKQDTQGGGRKPASMQNTTRISDKGMLIFSHTGEVIKAENVLKDAGYLVQVQAPPPELHTGCDMVVVIELMSEIAIRELLVTHNNAPLEILPIDHDLLSPVSLYHVHDYGSWLMVRAANMKITVEKESHIIVNISGGGCPDVPYLAHKLLGLTLEEAQEPRHIGQTLCCYSLQKAFSEARRLLCG